MKWKVRLTGDVKGLKILAESFTDDPEIFKEEDDFYLWCSQFEDLKDASEVRDTAREIVQTIRNIGLRDSLRTDDLQASHVRKMRDDGTERVFASLEAETVSVETRSMRINRTDEEGNEKVQRPADRTYELTRIASEDEKIRELAGLLDNGEDWVNLYRIYEFIQANIVEKDWWSSTEKDRFKRTANSREAIGDEARHADQTGGNPIDPMTHEEAKQLIRNLVIEWIESKE